MPPQSLPAGPARSPSRARTLLAASLGALGACAVGAGYLLAARSAGAETAPGTPAAPLAAAAQRYTLENAANTFSMDKIEKTKAGYVYWFFDKQFADGKTLKLSVVRPGEASHAPHSHPEDEFFFVLSGTAEFRLDGKTKIVGPRSGLYAPSNVEHGIRNAGATDLEYLVIKQYPNVEQAPSPGAPRAKP